MSWLFAVLIPGLLMLATFGLERLESSLGVTNGRDAIDELVALSPTPAAHPTPAPVLTEAATSGGHPQRTFTGLAALEDEPRLPTRVRHSDGANTQFRPTRHANPV